MIIACIASFAFGICATIFYEEARDWLRTSRKIRRAPITYTQGAAYDACEDEPVTDYDIEQVRKLLESW